MNEFRKDVEAKIHRMRIDGWANTIAGIAGSQDKSINTYHSAVGNIADEFLASMYVEEELTHKVVSTLPKDMTREWIEIEGERELIDKLETKMDQLAVISAFDDALNWKRLFGGSIILMGIMDGQQLDKPVNRKRIKSVEYLKVIDRTDIHTDLCQFYDDPRDANYGKIKYYNVNLRNNNHGAVRPNQLIHESRVLEFKSSPVPEVYIQTDSDLRYWGLPYIRYVYDQLRDMGGVNAGIANLLYEYVVGIYRMNGLGNILAQEGGEKKVIERMEIINTSKSLINAIILDADKESFDRNTASLQGLPDVMDRFMMFLASVSDYPVTKLFGRSPAGMNATGESDMAMYYDEVKAAQTRDMKQPIDKFLSYLADSKEDGFNYDDITWDFKPLDQLNEKEQAEVNKIKADTKKVIAETYKTLIDTGIVDGTALEAIVKEEFEL